MAEEQLYKLKGTVEDVVFRREDSGFTVIEVSCDFDELVTVVGVMTDVSCGEVLEIEGTWDVHPSFGRQLRAQKIVRYLPEGATAIYKYLASGTVKGIGHGLAQKLVDAFGENTFDVIENDPERMTQIKGISKKMAKSFSDEFKKQFEIRETMVALTAMGLSSTEALKAYKLFKAEAVDFIKENPYIMCRSDMAVSFDRADEIASSLSIEPQFKHRANAGVIYVIKHNLGIGHTCLPRQRMLKPCSQLLECSEDEVEIIIDDLIDEKQIVSEDINGKEFLFLPDVYNAEKGIADRFKLLRRFPPSGSEVFPGEIASFEAVCNINLDEKQRTAIKTAIEKGMLILTGGPGTGKTTTEKGIIDLMVKRGLEVALAAPTGRAAKRMTELTGYEAKTIHRLLGVEWQENGELNFTHNMQNLLDIDAIIIDELSMVDVPLFDALLCALPLGCRIVMVGDSDQLPPVGAGNVLHDLIESGCVPVVKLSQVFRQENQSTIVDNAHAIVRGEMPDIGRRDKNSDFFFMQENNPFSAVNTVVELCTKRLVKAYDYSPFDNIQVLCPSRLGELGTVNLNKQLQAVLNPKDKLKKEITYRGYILREGDKVMQIKNNYDVPWTKDGENGTGVFNGDIGILKEIDIANATLYVAFPDRDAMYSLENASELELAYAMTVHKSQGSEFDAVIMPMLGVPAPLCYRNLLYTAVTRAKSLLVMVGSPKVMQAMIDNDKKSRRYSALCHFFEKEETSSF